MFSTLSILTDLLQSGHASAVLLNHLTADGNELLRGNGPGQKTNIGALVEGGFFAMAAQDQHRNRGKARGQFGDKGGAPHPWAVESDNDQAKAAGEISIFN